MKRYYSTLTAAMALLLTSTACGQNSDNNVEPANEPGAGEQAEETAAAAGDVLEDAGQAIVQGLEDTAESIGSAIDKEVTELNALGLTARNILDEEVRTPAGVVAARVNDILFSVDGRPMMAVLNEGGMFGVGDDQIIVTIQRLIITKDADGEASVEITLSNEELESLSDGVTFLPADFSVGGEIDTSLLSIRKMLDAVVYNTEGQKVADAYDYILGAEWKIDRVVVSIGGIADIGDRLVAAGWDMFTLTSDSSALQTTDNAIDFDSLPTFEYESLAK